MSLHGGKTMNGEEAGSKSEGRNQVTKNSGRFDFHFGRSPHEVVRSLSFPRDGRGLTA